MGQPASEVVVGEGLEAIGTPGVTVVGRTPWQIFWGRFRKDTIAIAGALFIVALIIIAVSAPILTKILVHHGPNDQFQDVGLNEFSIPLGPNSRFWFGFDS